MTKLGAFSVLKKFFWVAMSYYEKNTDRFLNPKELQSIITLLLMAWTTPNKSLHLFESQFPCNRKEENYSNSSSTYYLLDDLCARHWGGSLYYVSGSTYTVWIKYHYPHFIDKDIETNQIKEQSWDSDQFGKTLKFIFLSTFLYVPKG